MSAKIAVAIAHGICVGNKFDEEENSQYAQGMAKALKLKLAEIAKQSGSEAHKLEWADSKLAISAINWTPVLREERESLYQKLGVDRLDSFFGLREFIFQAISDSLTYQITKEKVTVVIGRAKA